MKKSLFVFLCSLAPIFGSIHEINHFSEVQNFVDSETLVILDIDDTVMIPAQTLGNGAWFEFRWDEYCKQGFDRSKALEKTLAEWEAIRHLTKMQLVEPEVETVIRSLQDQNIALMGITHQGLALATRTGLQLKDLNVDLMRTALSIQDQCLDVSGHTVLFRKGILFTSGKAKGLSFFSLMDSLKSKNFKIVMVDDKRSNLEDVEKEAEKRGIEFIGCRYNFLDEQNENFSSDLAYIQFRFSTFGHILSDDEATMVLQEGVGP